MTPRRDHPSILAPSAAASIGGAKVRRGAGPGVRAVDTVRNGQLRMDLRVERACLELRLAGSFHPGAADRLQVVLSSLERLDLPVHVNAGRVALIDVHDLVAFAEAARRRKAQRLAPLLLTEFSGTFARLLVTVRVPAAQFNDPLCWPLDGLASGSETVRRKGHLRLLPGYGRADDEGAVDSLSGRGPRATT